MAFSHYLPATFLAFFSNDAVTPRRDRRVAVGDVANTRVFDAKVANVAGVNSLYNGRSALMDEAGYEALWGEYEGDLAPAIVQLTERTLDARTWITVLVPFVAAMFVRGPDFNDRFAARLEPFRDRAVQSTNGARLIELNRLLAPVAAATWILMQVAPGGTLITNDIAFTGQRHPGGEIGLAIPVGQEHVLGLIPRRRGAVAVAQGGVWTPVIEYMQLREGSHELLNQLLASEAQRFIFGPTRPIVEQYLRHGTARNKRAVEPAELGFLVGRAAAPHQHVWHRLIESLASLLNGELRRTQ